MRKLLLIATLSLGAFAVAQTQGNNVSDTPTANNDWYNQRVSTIVQMYERIEAASVPSVTSAAPSANQMGTQPGSMASNTGSQRADNDWYNQRLAKLVNQYERDLAEAVPSTTVSR